MDGVQLKVARQVENIKLFQEALAKSSQLSKGMCSILSSFDERLMKLERTILPVYHETGNLQRRQENIERTLAQLEEVVQLYGVSQMAKPKISQGPSDQNLSTFLEAIEQVEKARDYFEQNSPHNIEANLLEQLFNEGVASLQAEFEALLSRHSRPVAPIAILDLVEECSSSTAPANSGALEPLPPSVVADLARISAWLRKRGLSEHLDAYATQRSRVLQRSMQGLREHHKTGSASSGTLPPQPSSSPQLGGNRKSRVPRRLHDALMRGLRRATDAGLQEPSRDELLDQEVEAYLTTLTALCRLMQAEDELLRKVLGPDPPLALERVVLIALEGVTQEGEALAGRVKRCVARHDFVSVLCLFPVLQHVRSLRKDYESLLAGPNSGRSAASRLPSLAVTLQTTLNKALEELVDSVKGDPEGKMPRDGTVHELTSNVMVVLEQLLGFVEAAGAVLAVWDLASFSQSRDPNRAALAQYVTRVLSALNLTLHNKSARYEDQALQAVFRLNNLHYVLRALVRSGLLEVVQMYEPTLGQQYEEQIRDQKRLYSQSWSRVLHYVLEVERPLSTSLAASGAKLRDKDRQSIKDKFTGFNRELEELYRVQKAYAVPDVELRESLKRDNKEFVLPKYKLFYEKYSAVPFTKNPDKYLKYTPLQVSNLIDQFFDAAA
ncbi:exocyst complex component 7 [Amblyomma americanum]